MTLYSVLLTGSQENVDSLNSHAPGLQTNKGMTLVRPKLQFYEKLSRHEFY